MMWSHLRSSGLEEPDGPRAQVKNPGKVTEIPWPDERKKLEVGDVSVDIRKIADRLGWVPLTTIDEGLRTTLDFYRQNLWKYI
jgi:nucleoside-diphosphate-sugar epimerase